MTSRSGAGPWTVSGSSRSRRSKVLSMPGRPSQWSTCRWVMNTSVMSLRPIERTSWRCVPSPQSNSTRSPPRRTSRAGRPRRAVGAEPAAPAKNSERAIAARSVVAVCVAVVVLLSPAPSDDGPGRDGAAYPGLRGATAPAARRAAPHAPVILGGLTGNDYRFLADVYRHGGRGSFDAVAVHTDTGCNLAAPSGYLRDL